MDYLRALFEIYIVVNISNVHFDKTSLSDSVFPARNLNILPTLV